MPKLLEIIRISIDELKISPLYNDLFADFWRDRNALYNEIKTNGFDQTCALKVRKSSRRKNYEVLCGAGRLIVQQKLSKESKYPVKIHQEMMCEIFDLDDEEAVALMLEENLNARRSLTGFGKFQFYAAADTLNKFPSRKFSKDLIKKELNIKETTYQNLHSSYDYAIEKIKNLYPEFAAEVRKQAEGNRDAEILSDIKLINYAVEKNEWFDFVKFFRGEMPISVFYKEVRQKCPPSEPSLRFSITEKPSLKKKAASIMSQVYKILKDVKEGKVKIDNFTPEDFTNHQETFRQFLEVIAPGNPANSERKASIGKSGAMIREDSQRGLFD